MAKIDIIIVKTFFIKAPLFTGLFELLSHCPFYRIIFDLSKSYCIYTYIL